VTISADEVDLLSLVSLLVQLTAEVAGTLVVQLTLTAALASAK